MTRSKDRDEWDEDVEMDVWSNINERSKDRDEWDKDVEMDVWSNINDKKQG